MAGATGGTTADGALLRWVQRRERALIVAWLAGCAALLAFIGVWGLALNGAERAVESWGERWVRELGELEADVAAGRCAVALPRLEQLDRDCPAVFVKHRQDKERERLLALLGECHAKLDHRKKAIEALERLVAFDPRNFDNHFRLAEAQRAFGDDAQARKAYDEVLAIHPTHLPSVTAVIHAAFAAGNYGQVVADYERYLHTWLLAPVRVEFGETAVALEAPVDGETHAVEGVVELPAGWSGAVRVKTGGFSARVESLELVPPLRVGVVAERAPVIIPTDQFQSLGEWSPAPMGEEWSRSRESGLSSFPFALPDGAARVRLKLALFKALPADTWTEVRKSYRNRLELDKLREAERRSRVGGCLEGGTVFED